MRIRERLASSFPKRTIGEHAFRGRIWIALPAVLLGVWLAPSRPADRDASQLLQVVCGTIVFGGLALRAWGAAAAGHHTRTAMLEAPALATHGPYAHVRNQIYLGTFTIGVGMVGLLNNPALLLPYAGVLVFFTCIIVPGEELFLRRRHGNAYRRYCSAVPRYWPRLQPWPERLWRPLDWQAARGECWIIILLAVIYAVLRAAEK